MERLIIAVEYYGIDANKNPRFGVSSTIDGPNDVVNLGQFGRWVRDPSELRVENVVGESALHEELKQRASALVERFRTVNEPKEL
jgi:hypothetical protein